MELWFEAVLVDVGCKYIIYALHMYAASSAFDLESSPWYCVGVHALNKKGPLLDASKVIQLNGSIMEGLFCCLIPRDTYGHSSNLLKVHLCILLLRSVQPYSKKLHNLQLLENDLPLGIQICDFGD